MTFPSGRHILNSSVDFEHHDAAVFLVIDLGNVDEADSARGVVGDFMFQVYKVTLRAMSGSRRGVATLGSFAYSACRLEHRGIPLAHS